jgi:hypothetical protein
MRLPADGEPGVGCCERSPAGRWARSSAATGALS